MDSKQCLKHLYSIFETVDERKERRIEVWFAYESSELVASRLKTRINYLQVRKSLETKNCSLVFSVEYDIFLWYVDGLLSKWVSQTINEMNEGFFKTAVSVLTSLPWLGKHSFVTPPKARSGTFGQWPAFHIFVDQQQHVKR